MIRFICDDKKIGFSIVWPWWLMRLCGIKPDWRTVAHGKSSRSWKTRNGILEIQRHEFLKPKE